jgi:hypothetical protein
LVRIVLVIGLVGFVALDAGSPLVVKAQSDDIAHQAADDSAFEFLQSHNADSAKAVAVQDAVGKRAELTEFSIDEAGATHVTVVKEARSVLFKKWKRLRSWYHVKAHAVSQRRGQ